jgi:D-arabinose 1-dehydrogenase-like Zn-dependent alcohol dehydrogenase
MRALMLKHPGTPPHLSVVDLPVPRPSPGEALVRVSACGFCHHDRLVMSGVLRRGVRPGVVLGHEIAGVVEEVGNDVDRIRPGDRVVSLLTNACGQCDRCRMGREHRCRNGEGIGHGRNGGFAEYVTVSQHSLALLPDALELSAAALLACPAGVALQALSTLEAAAGETVAVTGAGGGLGVHAVQLAVSLGARTLAVTSSPHKAPALAGYGADEVIEAGELDFAEVVMALTADEGADTVIETVGAATLRSSVRSLAQYGRLALLGEVGGEGSLRGVIPEIVFRDARVSGVSGVSRRTLERAVALATEGKLTPVLQEVMPLEEAERAYELVSSRAVLGRVALAASL